MNPLNNLNSSKRIFFSFTHFNHVCRLLQLYVLDGCLTFGMPSFDIIIIIVIILNLFFNSFINYIIKFWFKIIFTSFYEVWTLKVEAFNLWCSIHFYFQCMYKNLTVLESSSSSSRDIMWCFFRFVLCMACFSARLEN